MSMLHSSLVLCYCSKVTDADQQVARVLLVLRHVTCLDQPGVNSSLGDRRDSVFRILHWSNMEESLCKYLLI